LLRRSTDVEMFLKILILFLTAHLNQHIVNTISIKKYDSLIKLGFKTVNDSQEMTADDQVQSVPTNPKQKDSRQSVISGGRKTRIYGGAKITT
jgi:hypothetical protein